MRGCRKTGMRDLESGRRGEKHIKSTEGKATER